MLTEQQKNDYLNRISASTPAEISAAELDKLQLAHLQSVPFENLDISLKRKISLTEADIFNKLVYQNRGGFCYELNYSFYLLLKAFGFKVSLLSAQVFNGSEYGQEFDHLLLLVELGEKTVIADVGFGDSFLKTVNIDGSVSEENYSNYQVITDNNHYYLQKMQTSENWQIQYKFTLAPRQLSDFETMAQYHQTSKDSPFTQKSTCTIATPNGRLTISGQKLITTNDNCKPEHFISDANQYYTELKNLFGISLADNNKLYEKISKQ